MTNEIFKNSLFPGTKWRKIRDGYVRSHFIPKNTIITIESIMVSVDSAMVIFNFGVRRFQVDAIEFRKLFGGVS